MNSQEAQQAQTIAEIEAVRDDGDYHRSYYRATVDKALSLIYHQAQKIAEARQAAESLRARYTARIAGDSQAKHYERADLLFPWEKP